MSRLTVSMVEMAKTLDLLSQFYVRLAVRSSGDVEFIGQGDWDVSVKQFLLEAYSDKVKGEIFFQGFGKASHDDVVSIRVAAVSDDTPPLFSRLQRASTIISEGELMFRLALLQAHLPKDRQVVFGIRCVRSPALVTTVAYGADDVPKSLNLLREGGGNVTVSVRERVEGNLGYAFGSRIGKEIEWKVAA